MTLYIVFRDGQLVGLAPAGTNTYRDRGVKKGTHHYVVMAWRTELPISKSVPVKV